MLHTFAFPDEENKFKEEGKTMHREPHRGIMHSMLLLTFFLYMHTKFCVHAVWAYYFRTQCNVSAIEGERMMQISLVRNLLDMGLLGLAVTCIADH
jgi:hypothetical protein